MRRKKSICLFLYIISVMTMFACTRVSEDEYTIQKAGNLGDELGYVGESKNHLNQEYVHMDNNVKKLDGYSFMLEDYFFDPVTGIVAYTIRISKENGESLDASYQSILDVYADNDISVSFETTSNMNESKLKKEGDEIYLYESQQLSLLEVGKKTYTDTDEGLNRMFLRWQEKEICFYLPSYCLQQEVITFDVSHSDKVMLCILSEQGLNIVWKLDSVLEQFEEKMSAEEIKQGENFDRENYDYVVYEKIEILYANGEKKDVTKELQIESCIDDNREEEKLGNTRFYFKEKIDLENVGAILIDGQEYNF